MPSTEAAPRRVAVDIVQAQRVDVVQGFEVAVFVPPLVGQAAEFVDFGLIDIDMLLLLVHGKSPKSVGKRLLYSKAAAAA